MNREAACVRVSHSSGEKCSFGICSFDSLHYRTKFAHIGYGNASDLAGSGKFSQMGPVNTSHISWFTHSTVGPHIWSALEWHWGKINWIRGQLGLSLLCVKERTPVASSPDWSIKVPVARQPSSGVWGLADRQLLMKLRWWVEWECCRKGLCNLFSHALHILNYICKPQLHWCSYAHVISFTSCPY